jgi:hypothetical protein
MPRLSLYRPEKGNDFKFFDRVINEQFQVGGTDIYIHKYLGPVNPEDGTSSPTTPTNTNPIAELGIQDLLLMENRDRHYAPDVYVARAIYTMQDIDFNLSQFGIFLQNDTVMIHVHLRTMVELLGRKVMSGDVLELPHLKDEYALDNAMVALKRFYVVQDVTRPAAGFSPTWYPHLLRLKCVPMVDSQEFKEILDQEQTDTQGNPTNQTLRDLLSTYNTAIDTNNAILAQAEADLPRSGYDTTPFFVVPINAEGKVDIEDVSDVTIDASIESVLGVDASMVLRSPEHNYSIGYLTNDGTPPNGAPYSFGIEWPVRPVAGQFHLRTDYFPNRLFRFDGAHWIKFEDNVRMDVTNKPMDGSNTHPNSETRQTEVTSFINNTTTATIANKVVVQRQALSKVLKPKADQ